VSKGKKTSLELGGLLKKLGVKIIHSKIRGKWPKGLKLRAIDEALKLAKKRPATHAEIDFDYDDNDNRVFESASFCAIGCLAAVTGNRLVLKQKNEWSDLRSVEFKGNVQKTLAKKTFGNDNLTNVIDRNDSPAGNPKNSTVYALQWLRTQIAKE
jgi:hypothetical protein